MAASTRTSVTAAVLAPGTWTVDAARSTVAFKLRHLMVVPVRGGFSAFEGAVTVDPSGRAVARGSVETAWLDTGDAIRDERLRGPEFFDSESHPKIRFSSTEVEALDERTLRIAGELQIGRIARPIELRAARGRGTGGDRVELEIRGTLSRREFGIESPQLLDAGISDRVEIELAVSLAKAG
jgi:polyisoprenoid-binding protein YceI